MNSCLPVIEHVVVVMFENRSFDHVFGALPGVEGVLDGSRNLKPGLYNLPDPTQPPSPGNEKVFPTVITLDEQRQLIPHDFNHDFCDGMMPDLFGPGTTGFKHGQPIGNPAVTYPENNSGFISSLYYPPEKPPLPTPRYPPAPEHPFPTGPSAMTYFKLGELPVLHTLAQQFVVCDNWYCDMPGHTLPNRLFMHCAETGNLEIADNDQGACDSKTIFQLINESQPSWQWGIYAASEKTDSSFLRHIRHDPRGRFSIGRFAQDVQNGDLPFYSFVMCWGGKTVDTDTSMHPASRMEPGENYLAAIYNALIASPAWDKTLLIVTFDENGGIYDHLRPPLTAPPVPGKIAHGDYHGIHAEFDFSLLGPRIPAILISPWLKPGVDHTQYQNTSILRLLEDLMAAQDSQPLFLTRRDQNAKSIAEAFCLFGLQEARTGFQAAPHHPGFPFSAGLYGPITLDEPGVPPAPHMAEVERMYASSDEVD